MQSKLLARCALFAALMCLCAWISLPFGESPITLQTFALFLTLELLGGKYGSLVCLIYLLLGSVGLPKPERCRLLDESLGGAVHPYLLNFMKILVEKGKIRTFPGCFSAYQQEYYRDHNILPVTAVTAIALSQSQVQRLTDKLHSITGKQILLSNEVEPALLGGVRLDYDGKQLEDSIALRMQNLRQLLKNTVL